MVDPKYIQILRIIYVRLNDEGVNWVVVGSLSLALQGVPIEVHDIDIETDETGAYAIERLFSDLVIRRIAFSSAERIRSHFGALLIDGVEVEVMGDVQHRLEDGSWEDPVDLVLHRRFVHVEDMSVPVLSVEFAYQAYLKLDRVKTAELLARWLRDRRYAL